MSELTVKPWCRTTVKKFNLSLKSFGIAIAFVTIATGLKLLIRPFIEVESPFLLMFAAVMLSALCGGMSAGVFATVLSALVSDYLFVAPIYSFVGNSFGQNLRLFMFITEGLIMSGTISSLAATQQRLKLEQATLRNSEERNRLMVDAVQDYAMFMLDPNGYVASWNTGAQRVKGYPAHEIIGQHFSCFYRPEDVQQGLPNSILQQASATGKAEREGWRVRKDGSQFWANTVITALRDEAGNLKGFSKVTRDITERKQVEANLRESEEKFRATFNQAAVGIAHVGVDGYLQLINQKLCDILGYTEVELFEKTVADITYPEDLEIDLENVRRVVANEIQAYSIEKRYLHKDGSIVWCNLTVSVVREANGEPKYLIGVVEDISDRKQTEFSLQQTNAILNAINTSTTTCIYVKDCAGRMVMANPATIAVIGKPEADIIGKTDVEFLPNREEGEFVMKNDLHVMETGEAEVYENTLELPKGRVTFLSTKSPYRDQAGNIIGLIGITTDISDRKRFEESLEAKNREVTNILDSITDGFVSLDGEWRYTYVNSVAEKILDKQKSELLGCSIWDVFPEAVDLPGYGYCYQCVNEQITVEYEEFNPFLGKWLNIRLYPSAPGLTLYFQDVTERKQAEKALQRSEQRFRNLADSMPQLVWTANPDGTVDYYNQRLQEFIGFSQRIDGSWEWHPVLHPDDQQRTVEAWARAIETGEIYECEHRVQKTDGKFVWHLSRAFPVKDQQGRISKWYGTATDIHTQKQYQAEREELLQREQAARAEAEAASQMKDEFLATLSHELRTPMNSMLGWLVILRTRKLDETTTARVLQTIERNTQSLNQLIEDILDISRIIRGKIHLNMQSVNLLSVLESALDTVKATAEAKQIGINSDFDPEWSASDQLVWGDPNRLQQILWNLLSNAIKFTPQDGFIRVRVSVVSRVSVDGEHDLQASLDSTAAALNPPLRQYAQIQITDSGIGIEPEFLPHVFERFRQADGSITRSHGGLGLGLSIVRQLVELHGGTVEATSAGPGQGSTFTVYLPLLMSQQSPRLLGGSTDYSLPPSGKYSLNGLRVLVVDDEPDVRELLTVVLKESGVQVIPVASAKSAFEAVQKLRPNVLVSDIGMPTEDGYSLIQRVRTLPAGAGGAIPAIALTAYATPEDRQKALAAGFQQHLTKPIDPNQLTDAIATIASLAISSSIS